MKSNPPIILGTHYHRPHQIVVTAIVLFDNRFKPGKIPQT
jgi:hypothetical protein